MSKKVCASEKIAEVIRKNQANHNTTYFAGCCLCIISCKHFKGLKTHDPKTVSPIGNFLGRRAHLPTDSSEIEEIILNILKNTRFKPHNIIFDKDHDYGQLYRSSLEMKLTIGKLRAQARQTNEEIEALKKRIENLESEDTNYKPQKRLKKELDKDD